MQSAGCRTFTLLAAALLVAGCESNAAGEQAAGPVAALPPPTTAPALIADADDGPDAVAEPTGTEPVASPTGDPAAMATMQQAVDRLLTAPHLDYRSTMDSFNEVFGRVTIITEGVWSTESPTSELRLGVLVDDRAEAALGVTIDTAEGPSVELDDVIDILDQGFVYRFFPTEAWLFVDGRWIGNELGLNPTDEVLVAATDVGRIVSELFDNPDEPPRWVEASTDSNGRATYVAAMDADTVIPTLGPTSSIDRLLDAGWDGVTGLTVDVRASLDEQGRLVRFSLDETEWYRSGWAALGFADLAGEAAVTLAFDISYPSGPTIHEVPCTDPVAPPDAEPGFFGSC